MHNYFKQYIKAVSQPLPEMANYFEKENNYLKNLITSNSIVLDVGCGNGRTMKFLSPYAKKIVGVDYDPKMIASARENLSSFSNIELLQKNFFETEFHENFDLVFASYSLLGSLETKSEDRKPLLQKMTSHTKSGGHMVVSAWSVSGIDFAKKYYPYIGMNVLEIKDDCVITNQGTIKRFSKQDLEKLAEGIGRSYSIVELTDLFYLLDFVI
jgi:ubiquinone/menaquinone biosynthesis C-methylase UbiE